MRPSDPNFWSQVTAKCGHKWPRALWRFCWPCQRMWRFVVVSDGTLWSQVAQILFFCLWSQVTGFCGRKWPPCLLAGCCWEVYATRADPKESLTSLRQVSKCLTMMLAIYLAKEVAAILRAILTHPTKKLYDDRTAHLLCSNYWMQPIFQELLHSSSRYNATRTGERNRPSSGLARISAHPRPPKKLKPSASGTRFTDWIGGICYADTLHGFLPTGPQWYFASCKTRRMLTEQLTHLGWTWMWLRMILRSSGRRPTTTGGCSSRWASTRIAISVC